MNSSTSTDANWEALVAEFRALGGTAENITLRRGPRGRGLFPIDPAKPVRLRVPPNLLVPPKDVELRDGQLVVKASTTLGERERAFFDCYQRDLCWGAGMLDDLWHEQLEWSQLPREVQSTLREIAFTDPTTRFSEPSEELCLHQYVTTRQIGFHGAHVLMPILELVNCSGMAAGYDCRDGIAISGKFDEEVFVNYNPMDCWARALIFGFCEETFFAQSLPFRHQSEDQRIQIRKEYHRKEHFNGFPLPVVRVGEDGVVEFSYLMLGNVRNPRVPRAVFHHVTKNTPIKRPDELFDVIQHYNRVQLLKFLSVSEGLTAGLAAMLRGAAHQQLVTLSCYWGTRSLGADGSVQPEFVARR